MNITPEERAIWEKVDREYHKQDAEYYIQSYSEEHEIDYDSIDWDKLIDMYYKYQDVDVAEFDTWTEVVRTYFEN